MVRFLILQGPIRNMVQKGIFLVGGIEGEQMIDITFFMHAPP